MNRFRMFVVGNLCVISLVGWLQWTLFDYGGPSAAASHWVARGSGARWHKCGSGRSRRRRASPAPVLVETPPEDPPWNG